MKQVRVARGAGWGTLLAALLLCGCSVTPGNRLILFPEGNRLMDAAVAMRQAATEPQALPRELAKQVLPPYTVEPGDTLLVQPADLESAIRLPGDQPVLPDGTINLGRYGQVIVAGKTVPEIETLIRNIIQAQLNAQPAPAPQANAGDEGRPPPPRTVGPISVRVVTRVSKVYYVLGEVNAPGAFTLNGRETVLDGILAAGGLTDRASRGNIILSRPTPPNSCRVVLPICYNEIVQLGDTATNYQLAPGDRIYVPTRGFCEGSGHARKQCGPCGNPQVPCPPVAAPAAHEPGAPPAPLPAPPPQYTAPPTTLPAPGEQLQAPRAELWQYTSSTQANAAGGRSGPARGSVWQRMVAFLGP